jgi:hypothetical protein
VFPTAILLHADEVIASTTALLRHLLRCKSLVLADFVADVAEKESGHARRREARRIRAFSLDHLVGAQEKPCRHIDPDCSGGLQVDD